MREIKFRAWDYQDKSMVSGSGFRMEGAGFNYQWGFQTGTHLIEVMQFTGLTDRNGKEIYEGDIVKRSFGRMHDIVWHDFTASFRIGRYAITAMAFQKMEVVGNIYEHPDLLK
jgi:uncharacterized phage protein (TIGR01671 family)